jgi:hypothetical protein
MEVTGIRGSRRKKLLILSQGKERALAIERGKDKIAICAELAFEEACCLSCCGWWGNHFISEKYKTVQSFKLHFLQNRHPVQLYTYASDRKVETFV